MIPEAKNKLKENVAESITQRRNKTLFSISQFMKKMSPGDVAQLRRLRYDDPSQPVFWKICARFLDEYMPKGEKSREKVERQWAVILCGMALTCRLQTPKIRVGTALCSAGYSELRFTRLLRATGVTLYTCILQSVRYLSAKGIAFDWADMADLIFSDDSSYRESVRRRLARNYYINNNS